MAGEKKCRDDQGLGSSLLQYDERAPSVFAMTPRRTHCCAPPRIPTPRCAPMTRCFPCFGGETKRATLCLNGNTGLQLPQLKRR
eukprot:scaffold257909_cov27-Tisochrysis_lutea.AAC.4